MYTKKGALTIAAGPSRKPPRMTNYTVSEALWSAVQLTCILHQYELQTHSMSASFHDRFCVKQALRSKLYSFPSCFKAPHFHLETSLLEQLPCLFQYALHLNRCTTLPRAHVQTSHVAVLFLLQPSTSETKYKSSTACSSTKKIK